MTKDGFLKFTLQYLYLNKIVLQKDLLDLYLYKYIYIHNVSKRTYMYKKKKIHGSINNYPEILLVNQCIVQSEVCSSDHNIHRLVADQKLIGNRLQISVFKDICFKMIVVLFYSLENLVTAC